MASQETPPNLNSEYVDQTEVMRSGYLAQAAGSLVLHQDIGLVRVGADRYHDYSLDDVPIQAALLQVA